MLSITTIKSLVAHLETLMLSTGSLVAHLETHLLPSEYIIEFRIMVPCTRMERRLKMYREVHLAAFA